MFDVTFIIPDYDEPMEWIFTPTCPDDEMPEAEKDRLFEELCVRIDDGEFDPEREILI
jgi:hypothetical protein